MAYDYAERIRDQIPERLREVIEKKQLTAYGLEQSSGISRQMIARVLSGKSKGVSVCVVAQLSAGAGITFEEFARKLEEDARNSGRKSGNDV